MLDITEEFRLYPEMPDIAGSILLSRLFSLALALTI